VYTGSRLRRPGVVRTVDAEPDRGEPGCGAQGRGRAVSLARIEPESSATAEEEPMIAGLARYPRRTSLPTLKAGSRRDHR